MREKSTPQKKSSKDLKIKPIAKQPPKSKILKYKPHQGDQSKQWVIQAILNQRISLIPLPQPSTHKNHNPSKKQISQPQSNVFKNYQKIKEYEIAWAQNRKEGIWPNTWEPQENISQDTRLDYLLKKRNKMNQKKNKQSSHFKSRQNLQKHINFTMNKQQIGRRATTAEQRRNQSQKILKKVLHDKSPPKNKKSVDYKNWFYNFSPKTDEYQKMIDRFLKLQKNPKSKSKQVSNTTPPKFHNLKAEFVQSVQSIKEQINDDGVSQLLQKSENPQNKLQNTKYHDDKTEHVPKKICLKLVKEIAYIGEVDNVDRFILKFSDGSLRFIREDDLIRYLPWIYEKLMMETIEQELKETVEKLASTSVDNYFNGGRHLQQLSYEIGLPRNYFWEFQKEQNKRKNRFFTLSIQQSGKNGHDFSFFFESDQKQRQEEQQFANQQQDEEIKQIEKQIKELHVQKISQIQNCFDSLRFKLPQDDSFMNQPGFILGQVQNKISEDLKFTNCKYLFPCDSKLMNEWKNTKPIPQPQKPPNLKKQLRPESLKIENSFESQQSKQNRQKRQQKSNKKPKPALKIQSHEHNPNIKNKGEQIKREAIEIEEDSNKSARKSLNKHQKSPHKRVKIAEEEEQINKLLGELEQRPTNKKKDDFYDSEDESSIN